MALKAECIKDTENCGNRECGSKLMKFLLAAIPLSLILKIVGIGGVPIFIASCAAIIPLAGILGSATEEISVFTGPKIGGLLNATMGNIPELFIGIFSVKAGLFSLVKASVIGSISGNMLLVLGVSILVGGTKYKFQSFDKMIARTNFGLMFLALIGFIIPAAYKYLNAGSGAGLMGLSLGTAIVLLVIYLMGLFFSLYTHRNIFVKSEEGTEESERQWGLKKAIIYLIIAAAVLGFEAEILVDSIQSLKVIYGIPETFLGIVIVPVIGNIAEYTSSVLMAMKDKINISVEIAIGSSMQMALFVMPVLVLFSFIAGTPMNYAFTSFELVTAACSIGLSLYIFQDGRTNWLEGMELISAYIIMALAYFFMA